MGRNGGTKSTSLNKSVVENFHSDYHSNPKKIFANVLCTWFFASVYLTNICAFSVTEACVFSMVSEDLFGSLSSLNCIPYIRCVIIYTVSP